MNIVNKRLWYFLAAGLIVILCIVFLATEGLNRGIDFQAGTQLTVSFDQDISKSQLVDELSSLGYTDAAVSLSSRGHYYIQNQEMTNTQINQLKTDLTAKFGNMQMSSETIPQNVADESIRNAGIAVVISILAMLFYIAWTFRKMPSPFRYGVCAVAGLAFDAILTLGIYAILGSLLGWTIDLMFIAGILGLLGYSINNTIIVFDRVRENSARGISSDIEVVTNASIVQTLSRSFNSSITALITLFVLALFVGSAIQNFVVVLIIGTISGTLTSTFLSPELLVAWQKKSWGRLSNRNQANVDLAALKAKN
jgi:preprotein translocase subunit SecF